MSRLHLLFYITLALLSTSCKNKKSSAKMPPLKVEVTTAKIDSLYSRINVASQIEGLYDAVIQPRVNGFLLSTHYEAGMPVKRGDLLFTIDPATYATTLYAAKAALESARASEVLAQRNYERAEPLAAIDAISKSDLDQYRATYKAAVASTKSAEESLRSAELEIGYTKIYAPRGGIAAKTSASEGDYVGPGTLQSELTTISQIDTISVELPISTAKYLRYVDTNSPNSLDNATLLSDITLTLPDSSVYHHKGEYYYTLKNTPTSSSTVVIVAKFPNPSLLLKEGMFARVGANIGRRKGCITLPKTAVSQLQGVNSIWIIKPDSTAQWRTVTLGDSHGARWEIISGVEEGENVVVGGGLKLHNGVKVAASVAKE
ncbi:MAG: efflux RND transporter periplasmic adaptor subunit [Rikenellaceae bacterium]